MIGAEAPNKRMSHLAVASLRPVVMRGVMSKCTRLWRNALRSTTVGAVVAALVISGPLAAADSPAWGTFDRDPSVGVVYALEVHEDDLICGGAAFELDEGPDDPLRLDRWRSGMIAWNGETWRGVGYGHRETPLALQTFRGSLIVGGFGGVLQWDGHTWCSLGGLTGEPRGVKALAVFGGELVAAGLFEAIEGTPAANIARWDGSTWHPLGGGTNGQINVLVPYQGDLIAGGFFRQAGGSPAFYVARWNGAQWHALPPLHGAVYGATIYGGDLVVAGSFRGSAYGPFQRIARWDGRAWADLGGGMDGMVVTLHVHEDRLIAGGSFGRAGAAPCRNIAAWNGIEWSPIGAGLEHSPEAIATFRGTLVAAGAFGVRRWR